MKGEGVRATYIEGTEETTLNYEDFATYPEMGLVQFWSRTH